MYHFSCLHLGQIAQVRPSPTDHSIFHAFFFSAVTSPFLPFFSLAGKTMGMQGLLVEKKERKQQGSLGWSIDRTLNSNATFEVSIWSVYGFNSSTVLIHPSVWACGRA